MVNEEKIIQAFPPIADANSKVLILGTMPGVRSLELQQYYGHASNHFWQILFSLFDLPSLINYDERRALLLRNGIALWDVLDNCVREGSSDSNIKNPVVNDFKAFYSSHPHIHTVFWDSLTAQKLYLKYVGISSDKKYFLLPSPSARYARMNVATKIAAWRKITDYL